MSKRKKGEFGYLPYKKTRNLLIMIVSFAIVFTVLFTGIIINGTRNNLLTVLAILMVLPSAKMAVAYFVLLPHKNCGKDIYESTVKAAGNINVLSDIIVSNSKKPIGISALANTDSTVIAFSEDKNPDTKLFETSVKDFLKVDKLNVTVTLYTDFNTFLKRLKNLSTNFDENNEDCVRRMGYVKDAILRMSL